MFFKDSNLDKQLNDKGYVIAQLLDEAEVATALAEFETIRSQHPFPFTLCSPNENLKKDVYEKLKTALLPKLQNLVEGFKVTGANFYFKAKGSAVNTVPPHQDWTFVDEHQFYSLNIWIPLVDVDKSNGAYHIIEGSHKWPFTYRGSNIPSACANMKYSFDELTYLPLKKGQGIIYDHRLIHTTPPNQSVNDRVSLVLNLIPTEATLVHCISDKGNPGTVKTYEIDEAFNWRFTYNFQGNEMPSGYKLIAEENYVVPDFSSLHQPV